MYLGTPVDIFEKDFFQLEMWERLSLAIFEHIRINDLDLKIIALKLW